MDEKYQWNKIFTIIKNYENGVTRSNLISILHPENVCEVNYKELDQTINLLKRQKKIKELIGNDESNRFGILYIAVDNSRKDLTKREFVSQMDPIKSS